MSKAHALPTGLGIENEGLELPLEELPEWEESKIKTYPIVSIPIWVHCRNADILVLEEPSDRLTPFPSSSMRSQGASYRTPTSRFQL